VKPLLEKIAPGVYRELLLDRVAAAIGHPAERLQQWLAGAEPAATGAVRSAQAPLRTSARASVRAPVRTVGRGSLVTQAITLLLHFPTAASAVSEQQLRQLTQMKQDGVAVLVALLEQLGANPAATMAQTLERWRDKREYRRLCELGAGEPLVPDLPGARQELSQAVARLLDSELRRRLEVLIEKARGQALDDAEKLELQALTVAQTRVGGH
jgi:DNA primase